jgi:hypothetical protein
MTARARIIYLRGNSTAYNSGSNLLAVCCMSIREEHASIEVYGYVWLLSHGLCCKSRLRLPMVGYFKGYSKALEYEYRVKIDALGTLKRYSIISLTLYLE